LHTATARSESFSTLWSRDAKCSSRSIRGCLVVWSREDEFKSPSSLCLNSATTRDVHFRSQVLRKTAYKRRQERINANRRRARDQLPILLVGLHPPTLDHTTVPSVLPTQTQLSLSVGRHMTHVTTDGQLQQD
jgi:hypothetical protein